MKQIVECVPNFSEGRNQSTIDAIAQSVRDVNGAMLLGVEPDKDYNRTVITFVGDPESVVEAAFRATKKAAELIDMTQHSGAHPRMGATDVVPFIPVSGVTMDDCVALAKKYGARVAAELNIPLYLYEAAAATPQRRNLADVRKGEYEGLPAKLADAAWKPDFGAAVFHPKSGATITGARKFLIAYNVNLNTPDQTIAHEIALRIRESGRPKKDENGKVMKDANGESIKIPGTLKAAKAMGVLLERCNIAQVSINLVDFETTAVHTAFEEVRRQAESLGVSVTGSEIVGVTPLKALLMAADFYLQRDGKQLTVSEQEKVALAIDKLGLSQLDLFDPAKKIIEYQLHRAAPILTSKTVTDFLDELASSSPAPGGGSVAALAGALSSSLASMVCRLTIGKKKYADVQGEMEKILSESEEQRHSLTALIDEDTLAFNKVMAAFAMPKSSPQEIEARTNAIQDATKTAAVVPLTAMKHAERASLLALEVAQKGNANSITDAGVAALMARAACTGAKFNVLINLGSLNDQAFVDDMKQQAERIDGVVEEAAKKTVELVMHAVK